MAIKDQDLELDIEGEEGNSDPDGGKGKGKSKKLIIIIIIAVAVLLIVAGVAAFFMLTGGNSSTTDSEEEVVEEEKGPAIYVAVPQSLTSNLPGKRRSRTVQIKMTFVVRSTDAEIVVKTHMPQLKNDVLMLISRQSAEILKTPEGRVALQQKSLATVQATLTSLVGEPTIDKVLFTSFVMQ